MVAVSLPMTQPVRILVSSIEQTNQVRCKLQANSDFEALNPKRTFPVARVVHLRGHASAAVVATSVREPKERLGVAWGSRVLILRCDV